MECDMREAKFTWFKGGKLNAAGKIEQDISKFGFVNFPTKENIFEVTYFKNQFLFYYSQ